MYAMLKKNNDGALMNGPAVRSTPQNIAKSWVIRNPPARNVCRECSHFHQQDGRPQARISSTKQILLVKDYNTSEVFDEEES